MGRSPRVRGNRALNGALVETCGTIPACAGEPHRYPPSQPIRGDDPRVCGGTSGIEHPRRPVEGRSPRVRGNRHRHTWTTGVDGTIPACAGEPRTRPSRTA